MPFLTLITKWLTTVWQNVFGRLSQVNMQVTTQPLLSAEEVTDLAEELAQSHGKLSPNLKQSQALRQGEQASKFMGAGLEYEESRMYQPGDEIRRINWRLMARTGKAYTKLFQEEREENWFILVDHRASMRFGTRKRLKATQAVRVAGYFAWMAQQTSVPVAVGRLAEGFEQSQIFEGKSIYSHVMQVLCEPCPPVDSPHAEPSFNDVLIKLTAQLQPGSRLLLISDFDDINAQTTEILTALQDRVFIKAVWVKDIAEVQLPNIEGLQLQSMQNQQVYNVSGAMQRQNYQAWSMQYQADIYQKLTQAGVEVYSVFADESIAQIMHSLHSDNRNKGVQPLDNAAYVNSSSSEAESYV
ncbi:hypothetical protein JCM30760_00210 [Thiomicrorhabdus hydrogeniphila]